MFGPNFVKHCIAKGLKILGQASIIDYGSTQNVKFLIRLQPAELLMHDIRKSACILYTVEKCIYKHFL